MLVQADLFILLFTTQKNGFKGGSIGNVRTRHPQGCPVATMHRQVSYLQLHGATDKTPLSSYKKGTKWQQIQGGTSRPAIRYVIQAVGPSTGFTDSDISKRSLRAEGGMDLLMARVDPDTILLVGRWRSNTMLRYLQTTAKIFTEGLSAKMFEHGAYALIPPDHACN